MYPPRLDAGFPQGLNMNYQMRPGFVPRGVPPPFGRPFGPGGMRPGPGLPRPGMFRGPQMRPPMRPPPFMQPQPHVIPPYGVPPQGPPIPIVAAPRKVLINPNFKGGVEAVTSKFISFHSIIIFLILIFYKIN